MTAYYVDTSALAKRYIPEIGSAWVLSWIEPSAGNTSIISDFTPVEMFSVFARRQRMGSLASANISALQADFLLHAQNEYFTIAVDAGLLTQARTLVARYVLRSLDAIQLASAIRAKNLLNLPIIFVSGDKELLAAASAKGFAIDDPNAHP